MNKELRFATDELDKNIDRAVNDIPIAHLALTSLDRLIGGVRLGRLVCVSGEPGSGKTTLLGQIADDLSSQGELVIYFTYEIAPSQLIAKSVARMSGGKLAVGDIAGCYSDPERKAVLDEATQQYRNAVAPRIGYVDSACSAIEIGAMVSRCEHEFGRKPIVIVDYVQLIPSAADKPPYEERMQVKEAISGLRRVANVHEVPVFAISSINRSSYSKPVIGLDSLGGSSAVEYSADTVLFLSVQGKGDERAENLALPERPIVITALKNRYGAAGGVSLTFDTRHACFREVER